MLTNQVEQVAYHSGRRHPGDGHVFQQQQSAQDPVPLRDVASEGVTAALLASQQVVVR